MNVRSVTVFAAISLDLHETEHSSDFIALTNYTSARSPPSRWHHCCIVFAVILRDTQIVAVDSKKGPGHGLKRSRCTVLGIGLHQEDCKFGLVALTECTTRHHPLGFQSASCDIPIV